MTEFLPGFEKSMEVFDELFGSIDEELGGLAKKIIDQDKER